MFGKFHDEDYDGIVLKIPSWFIDINELHPDIKNIKEVLEKCNKSTMYLDHRNNLHELEYYISKKDKVDKARKIIKDEMETREKRQNMIYSGEMYQLIWENAKVSFDETVVINGKRYDYNDIFTNKLHIKAEFDKLFHSEINSFDKLKKLSKENSWAVMLSVDLELATEELFSTDYSLYCNSSAVLGMSYQRLHVMTGWQKGRKRGWCYRTQRLIIHPDGCLGINQGGNTENYIRLEGFERKGLYLVKKES